MKTQNLFHQMVQAFYDYNIIFHVAIAVFLILLFSTLANTFCHRLQERLKKTSKIWGDVFFYALRKPLIFFIWLVGLTYIGVISQHLSNEILSPSYFIFTREIGTILLLTWFLIRFVSLVEKRLLQVKNAAHKWDPTAVQGIGKLLRIVILVLAALGLLQALDIISLLSVAAFGGAGALIAGLAGKEVLSNFFGSLMIYSDRPFGVGDFIRLPDKHLEGHVEEIGWRTTRLRMLDKTPVYVPNSIFSSLPIQNASRMTHRWVDTIIGIRYSDASKIKNIITDIRSFLKNHPEIDSLQSVLVHLSNFGSSALEINIRAFTHTIDFEKFRDVQQSIFLKIIDIVAAQGAEIAFPTQTLYISDLLSLKGNNT